MAYEPSPGEPPRSRFSDNDERSAARLDSELQPDPELAEGPVSTTKFIMFIVAIAVVLGAVVYGLNRTSDQPGTSPTAQTQSSPGTTTGAAPAQPPSSAPKGQEVDRSANPANNPPGSK